MQIGSSFNFPQLPLRGQATPPRPAPAPQDTTEAPRRGPERVDEALFAERARSAQQARQDRTEYYSTDRELSLKGQQALDAYQTTSGFAFGGGDGELVGVDLYI